MNTTQTNKRLSVLTQARHGLEGDAPDTWDRSSVYLTDQGDGWILVIDGTPGQWFLRTLLESPQQSKIWIDVGQRWAWGNPQEVVSDAVMTLLELASLHFTTCQACFYGPAFSVVQH